MPALIEPEVGVKRLHIGGTTLTWEQGEFEWVWCMDFKLDPGVREFTLKAK